MYNRYLSGEYIPDQRPSYRQEEVVFPPSEPVQMTKLEAPQPVEGANGKSGSDLTGLLSGVLRGLRFDTDDLLLLAIIWLLVRDSGDDDILLIVAALFVMGFFKS